MAMSASHLESDELLSGDALMSARRYPSVSRSLLLLTRPLLTHSFDTCARRYPSVSRSLLLLTRHISRSLLTHSSDP